MSLLVTDIAQPILEELLYGSLVKSNSGGSSSGETAEARMKYLRNLVELLFGYLPLINRLRRSRTLAEERKEKQKIEASSTGALTSSSIHSARHEGTQYDIDSLIARNIEVAQHLEQILREVETHNNAASRAMINQTYSSLLAKEWQRMEDWSHDQGLHLVKTRTQLEVMKVQEELNGKLRNLVLDFGPSNLAREAVKSEKQALMTEEQIKDAVRCLNSATTHLYAATS